MKKILLFVSLILMVASVHGQVAMSELGYHPNGHKQVISYGGGGSYSIIDQSGNIVLSGQLGQDTCQGGQECYTADISHLSAPGKYRARAGGQTSNEFTIKNSVLADSTDLLLEFFQAAKQQGSAYHADLHKAQGPPFTMMADGSFIMVADMATIPLIRLASAYDRNPAIFSDIYTVTDPGRADIREYISMYVDYLKVLQDRDGTKSISRGWDNSFNCGTALPDQEKWNDAPEECMTFDVRTHKLFTTTALLAYLKSIPALEQGEQQEILQRSVDTYKYIMQTYTIGSDDESAYFGAALFLLHDYTGDEKYLREAHALKDYVSKGFTSEGTRGNEFYWEEFERHRQKIRDAGLTDFDAGALLATRTLSMRDSITNAEGVFDGFKGFEFQNSRYMLTEALLSAKASDLNPDQADELRKLAEAQLAWLTGQNRIEYLRNGQESRISKSFIFGIGNNPVEFHSRLVSAIYTENGGRFLNGKTHIPGWISGAYDSDQDGVLNHQDEWYDWKFTETTNEIVAQAIELFAYMDAVYEGSSPVTPPGQMPVNETDPPTTGTYYNLENMPASCTGMITSDRYDGGRHITCSGNGKTMSVDAWDKPTAEHPAYFEMYRSAGSGLKICLGNICIEDTGYAKSEDYPITVTQDPTDPVDPPAEDPEDPPVEPPAGTYHNLEDFPVRCEGGTITKDLFNGGRNIVCSAPGQSLTVQAWDKPGIENAKYFEMYKQQQTGSGVRICFGETCIAENGFARSPDYPIMVSDAGDDHEPVYLNVEKIPASCEGGSITQDLFNGGRNIVCSSTGKSLTVQAWDKPSLQDAKYFEMYKQQQIGSGLKICLLGTCIAENGFARSPDYPLEG